MMNRLHIGCGEKKIDGYTNIDILDYGQEVQADAFQYLTSIAKTAPGSIEEIRAEHFLEHFAQPIVIDYLNIANECLKVGGKFNIVVPGWKRPEAYFLVHFTVFNKSTFEMLGVKEFCEPYGIKTWRVTRVVENERGDIHCQLEKI